MNKENHPYWGNEIKIRKVENRQEIEAEDKINNKILDDCGVEKIFNKKIKNGDLPEGEQNPNWVYRKYNRYLDDKEPVYISLGFNMDDSKNHWSEVRISVIGEKLCMVRHKARGNIYNYYPIEDGKLEESVEKAIRHPVKWTRYF